jgi:hypothetical protein
MKNIKELTDNEGKEILKFVYPNEKDNYFLKISFEPVLNKDGHEQVSFSGRSIVGIQYHNGQDNCILHFNNTKVVLWLYKNGYDVTQYLEENSINSQIEEGFGNMVFELMQILKLTGNEPHFNEAFKYDLDLVKTKCIEIINKHYYDAEYE